MKYFFLIVGILLLGCPANQGVPFPRPLPTDTASCQTACAHIGPKSAGGLGCPEGDPLEDGTTCTKFCEDTQNSGHALNPSCVVGIKECKEIETTCAR